MNRLKHFLTTGLLTASAASFAQTTITIITDSATTTTTRRTGKAVAGIMSEFSVYLGLNNFAGGASSLPAGYELRPAGSRFVALAWQKRIPLFRSGSTKGRLVTGPELAWNNFMLEGSNRFTGQNGQLVVDAAPVALRKSKLVTTQLNLPLLLNVAFRSGLTLSAGAYAGLRLDSYTKDKPADGRAVRTHGRYGLNSARWGLTTELGFRGGTKLFGRYEPNSPFRTGQGPDVSVWAVGVKL